MADGIGWPQLLPQQWCKFAPSRQTSAQLLRQLFDASHGQVLASYGHVRDLPSKPGAVVPNEGKRVQQGAAGLKA